MLGIRSEVLKSEALKSEVLVVMATEKDEELERGTGAENKEAEADGDGKGEEAALKTVVVGVITDVEVGNFKVVVNTARGEEDEVGLRETTLLLRITGEEEKTFDKDGVGVANVCRAMDDEA